MRFGLDRPPGLRRIKHPVERRFPSRTRSIHVPCSRWWAGEGADRMACGDNNITRDHLSSAPVSLPLPGERLMNETARAEGDVTLKNSRGKEFTTERRYSDLNEYGDIHEFLDENRNKTLNTDLHIHKIHDERKNTVRLVITDRRGGKAAEHPVKLELTAPSGNEVNAAEASLAAVLRDLRLSGHD